MKKLGKMSLMLCVLLLLTALGGAAAAEEYPELQPICVDNCTTMYMSAPTIAAYSVDEYTYEQVYAIMLEAARAAEDFADLSGYNLGFSDANALYNAVRNENPELFYLVGGSFWSYGNTVSRVEFIYDEARLAGKAVFDAKVEKIISENIREGMSDAEKAMALHDYLVDNCEYVWDIPYDDPYDPVYDAYGALINEVAVCQGYTMAYKLLLNKVGIENDTALSDYMNHIWNLLCIDGEWYHVDVTWDDPVPDRPGWGSYDYFLVSDDTIKDSHHNHSGWDESRRICSSTKYESGYIFNDAWDLVHYYDGLYYVISGTGLYVGDMEGEPDKIYDLPYEVTSHGYPASLLEDNILYIPMLDYERITLGEYGWVLSIGRFDITTGDCATISDTVEFVRTESQDGKYPYMYDLVGLRVSDDGTTLEAVSSTRRQVLVSAEIKDHPVAWDNMVLEAGEHIRPAGVSVNGGRVHAGVMMSGSASEAQKVLAAFYEGGRMVKVFTADVVPGEGLWLCDWDASELGVWDGVRLFVLDGSFIPVCAEWSPAA